MASSLSDLTEEKIQEAFLRTLSETELDNATLILVSDESQCRKILQFLRNDFLKSEHVSMSAGLEWNPDIEEMCVSTLEQKLSLALIDDESGDVIGTRIMRIGKADEKFTEDQFENPSMKKMVNFWQHVDSIVKFYEHYQTDDGIHFFGLAVGSKYRNRGFGTKLVKISLKFLKHLNISPLYIKAEGSSIYSQRIFENLGFDLLAEVRYDDYTKDGKPVIGSSELNKAMRSYGKAFERALAETKVTIGQPVLVREEHFGKVLQFLKDDFFPTEYISQALNIQWSQNLGDLFLKAMKQRISLIMLDKESGDVMGIRLMAVSKPDDVLTEDQFDDLPMKQLVGFWKHGDEKTRFFEHYDIQKAIHYFGLGVAVKYRNKGVGTILADLSLKFLKNLNISPIHVKAEASSPYSMRIFEKLGFELISEVKYEDYKRDGEIVIASTDVNYCMKTYGLVIT